jgi:hypothetical protein
LEALESGRPLAGFLGDSLRPWEGEESLAEEGGLAGLLAPLELPRTSKGGFFPVSSFCLPFSPVLLFGCFDRDLLLLGVDLVRFACFDRDLLLLGVVLVLLLRSSFSLPLGRAL